MTVKEVRALDGVVTVEGEGGGEHPSGEVLARVIFVQTVPDSVGNLGPSRGR